MPDECALTTPTQSVVAMAASTADPPFFKMLTPMSEQTGTSQVTTP